MTDLEERYLLEDLERKTGLCYTLIVLECYIHVHV